MPLNIDSKKYAKKLWKGGNYQVSPEEAIRIWGVTEKTYYNYAGAVVKAGYAEYVESATGARKRDLGATEAGKKLVGVVPPEVAKPSMPTTTTATAMATALTPDLLQGYVDEYNEQNPRWQFELRPVGYRKEEPIEQRR